MVVPRHSATPTCYLTSPFLSLLFSFVFLLQTSSSTVVLSSQGLLPSATSSPPLTLLHPPPPTESSPGDHTPEALYTEENGQVLVPSVAPSWLDVGSLEETSATQNSRCPSVVGSQQSFGAKSQAQVRNDVADFMNEPVMTPLGHTPHPAGSTGSQGPLASHACSEQTVAPVGRCPQALTTSRHEIPHRVAVGQPAVLPDTGTLPKGCGQQERAQSELGALGSGCPAPGDQEQLGGKISQKRSLEGPTLLLKNPGSPEGGATEAAVEAGRGQPELSHAVAVGTPNTSERISTSGQAGTSLSCH